MKECCKVYLDGEFGGDADVIGEIYGEYVSSVHAKLAEIEAALAVPDWVKVDRAAHTVKGNALSAGDTVMAETAISMRKAAALQDAGEAASLLARLRELEKEL